MIVPKQYSDLRNQIKLDSVSLGYTEVHLFIEKEIENAQIGYGIDSDGNSLISNDEGSWQEDWLVIGYEECCGDPLFISTNEDGFPVYTAMNGEGEWSPTMIADSFDSFIKSLSYIDEVAKNRENPVRLENNPITEKEKNRIIDKISLVNPNSEIFFWENWLEQ